MAGERGPAAAESAAPGWCPDPSGGGGLRWWDESAWTGHVSAPAPHGTAAKTSGFAIASLLFGILPAPILADDGTGWRIDDIVEL